MNFFRQHSRKELWVTLSIWAVLMAGAISGLFLLRSNAMSIIENIHYVNVSRGAKAQVLYAEAEKNAIEVIQKAEKMNRLSGKKYLVPATDKNMLKSLELFDKAFEMDARSEFSPERTMYYELLGQVHDAGGNRTEQLIAHTKALIAQRDMDDAKDFIQLLREAEPALPEPLLLLAQLHDLNNNTTEALTVLNELYTSYTVTPKARWVNARIQGLTGKTELATEELRKVVDAEPDNLTYRRDLGNMLASRHHMHDAVKVLAPGLNDGGWLDAGYLHTYAIYLIEIDNLGEAIRILKQADQLAPYSGDVQWDLARAYHLAGKPKLAASTLRRATEIKPEYHNKVFETEDNG